MSAIRDITSIDLSNMHTLEGKRSIEVVVDRRSALQVRDCARTSDFHRFCPVAAAAVEHLEILAIREHIQRACGSKQSKYRQRCQGVQVSGGLDQQYFN